MTAQILTLAPRNAPNTDNGTVPPARQRNADVRRREHLEQSEVDQLIRTAKDNRNGHRDATMILLAYRHGLRVSELIDLRWSDVTDLGVAARAKLSIRRAKGSISASNPLEEDEVHALRKLRKDSPDSGYIFTSERGDPISAAGFRKMLSRLGEAAGLGALKIHPHMLRHTGGHLMVGGAMDLRTIAERLGHANLQNTRRYSAVNLERTRGFWHRHK